ncbi:MAG: DASS family sodium-coupled anion symporter [Lewinellaceae bacterium]|nr:DASS family sodium-coupled anion symporter [Lewinellaceae bacterium]
MFAKRISLLLGPAIFLLLLNLPTPAIMKPEAWRVLAIAAFMLIWWITEAVPLAVTSLLPIVLLPMLGVMKMDAAAAPYANSVVYLFLGGFMIALAMERWELHRRIALNIVQLTGTNANGILLGFMLATAFLSMWISNTATAIMMLPIGLSIINLLNRGEVANSPGLRNFSVVMMLGIAYGANIGGTATIIGTPPNVVFAGYMRETFGREISFASWMMVGTPFMIVLLAATYLLLVHILFPNRLGMFAGAQELIAAEVKELGPMGKGEKRTLVVFVATALAWIFRVPLDHLVPQLHLSDTGIALMAAISLFVIPVDFAKNQFVLAWRDTEKLPWGILLLFGGGLSLADALAQTGIVSLIGDQFKDLSTAGWIIILGLATVSLFLTEVMSNVALVTIFLPVVGAIALGMDLDPVLMCVPVTLAASCAFMLPMSTPPNAIVFASGHLRIMDMVKAGFLLNIITIILVTVVVKLLLPLIFQA